jgi:glycosyltransferase involved in cell wall biosynthesis
MLTPQLPYPPHQGTSLRNYNILKGISQQHQVSLLSFKNPEQDETSIELAPLENLCHQIVSIPKPEQKKQLQRIKNLITEQAPDLAHRLKSAEFNSALKQLLDRSKTGNSFDIVQIEGLEMASSIHTIREIDSTVKVILDNHNAETALQKRAFKTDLKEISRWPAAIYSFLQINKLRKFEFWACQASDWVTVVSEIDRQNILEIVPGISSLDVIPNCIDVEVYKKPRRFDTETRYDILFCGKMDYRPNIDGVIWFAKNIWPQLKQDRAKTNWAIVGQNPHPKIDWIGKLPGVTITGRVNEIQPYMWDSKVLIMPLRMGGGTRLKFIEAMSSQLPVVSTTIGAEGFDIQNGVNAILANKPADFAQAIVDLLNDSRKREDLARAALSYVQKYDWRRVTPQFDTVYKSLYA